MEKRTEITHGMLATTQKRFVNFIIDRFITTLLYLCISEGGNRLYDNYRIEALHFGPPVIENIKFSLLGICISIVYYGLSESLSMRTFGKFITGTMVVNRDGTTPDSTRILLRTLCRQIPLEALSFLLSPIGWHDRFSKTLVVDVKRFNAGEPKDNLDNTDKTE